MQVRAKNGLGPRLFDWDPEKQTIGIIHKDTFYQIYLGEKYYVIQDERPKKRPRVFINRPVKE